MVAERPATDPSRDGVLVLVAKNEGELDDADKGILAEGGKLARSLDIPWAAASFGAGSFDGYEHFGGRLRWPRTNPRFSGGFADSWSELATYGVPEILEIQADRDVADFPDAQAEALAQVARGRGSQVILLAHTDLGVALAPGLAARLGGALFTEAVSFEPSPEGLRLSRRALSSRAVETWSWSGSQPLILTVDPKVMSSVVLPSVKASRPTVGAVNVRIPGGCYDYRVLERIPPDPQTVDVAEAEVIFCAGKGFDPQSFGRLRELAELLNASLGVTRPVYDLGWADFERMIGQTGKTVAPRFYFGMGISGSMHHMGGIKDSKRLVCLNTDPKAPMFPNADEGFVADLREVLPLLLERVRARAAGGERS